MVKYVTASSVNESNERGWSVFVASGFLTVACCDRELHTEDQNSLELFMTVVLKRIWGDAIHLLNIPVCVSVLQAKTVSLYLVFQFVF